MKKLCCLCLWSICLLFTQQLLIAQNSCTNNRYIEDNFSVESISNIQFGTAPHGETGFLPIPLVTYSQTDTEPRDLFLDLYLPQGDTLTKRPLIVMAFGGAFITGFKTYGFLVDACEAWARKGFVVASIDYRLGFTLSPDAEAQAIRAVYRGIQDFAAAVRFLKANADTYNIDTNIIIGGGHSAGSFSALHDAFLVEADRAASTITLPTYEYVTSNGQTWPDLDCAECGGNDLNAAPNNLDGKIDIVLNLWGAIANLGWIDAGEPPVISFHGTADNIVPIDSGAPFGETIGGNFFPTTHGSIPIHERLNDVGIYNEIHIFEGAGHEPWVDGATHQYIVDSSAAFMVDVMKPNLPLITGTATVTTGSTHTYSVAPLTDATYCWEVTNGTITADNGPEIVVQWDAGITTGSVQARVINCNVVESDQATFNVTATPPQRAFAKVFLEGAYRSGTTPPLDNSLATSGTLPLNQTYSTAPWNYMGSESVATLPTNAVDWVLVELRDPTNFNVVVEQKAALLLDDGSLQDADGLAGVAFNTLVANGSTDYHLVVRHRNHLDVLSANAITLPNTAATAYDFSSAMNQALGAAQMVEIETGVYALYAGDIDGRGVINVKDFNEYVDEIGNSGYLQSDCNFDQNNTIIDFNFYRPNSSIIGVNQIRY